MTDIIVARRTLRGAVTVDVLPDAAPNWKTHYSESVVSLELVTGEATALKDHLDDITRRMNGDMRKLADAVDAWRTFRKHQTQS